MAPDGHRGLNLRSYITRFMRTSENLDDNSWAVMLNYAGMQATQTT